MLEPLLAVDEIADATAETADSTSYCTDSHAVATEVTADLGAPACTTQDIVVKPSNLFACRSIAHIARELSLVVDVAYQSCRRIGLGVEKAVICQVVGECICIRPRALGEERVVRVVSIRSRAYVVSPRIILVADGVTDALGGCRAQHVDTLPY